MFNVIFAICLIYTVVDIGLSVGVVRKLGVTETRNRVRALVVGR